MNPSPNRFRDLLRRVVSEQRQAPRNPKGKTLYENAKQCLDDPKATEEQFRCVLQSLVTYVQERSPDGLRAEAQKLIIDIAKALQVPKPAPRSTMLSERPIGGRLR